MNRLTTTLSVSLYILFRSTTMSASPQQLGLDACCFVTETGGKLPDPKLLAAKALSPHQRHTTLHRCPKRCTMGAGVVVRYNTFFWPRPISRLYFGTLSRWNLGQVFDLVPEKIETRLERFDESNGKRKAVW